MLPPLRGPRKPRKAPAAPTRHDWKARYTAARKVMFEREYPAAWAVGGYYDKDMPDVNTTNGITTYIIDVINNSGHFAERVNTGGIPRKDKRTGQYKMSYSGSTNGSTDIHIILLGPKPWKIEIKKGRDGLSPAQEKYQSRSLAVGALHSVIYVGDTDGFWDLLDEYCKHL